jgi:acetolactate synthase-1/2/3 large subunit
MTSVTPQVDVDMAASELAKDGRVRGSDLLLDTFAAHGIDDIFSSPGSEWVSVWEALARRKMDGRPAPTYWNTRHEALAVATAMGYHKATHKPAAALFHASVGPLNGAMAIRSAYHEAVPLVILAADSFTFGEGRERELGPSARWLRHLSDSGPSRSVDAYVKWADTAATVESFGPMLAQACRVALTPPYGPAFLTVGLEALLAQDIPAGLVPRSSAPSTVQLPDPAGIEGISRLLLECSSPVIVTEYSGRQPDNMAKLVHLAEELAIPVVEALSPGYLNFPRNHPYHWGFDLNDRIMDRCDGLLLLGVRGPWAPASRWNTYSGRVILADDNVSKIESRAWAYSTDLVVSGGITEILDQVTYRITQPGALDDEARERVARRRADMTARAHSGAQRDPATMPARGQSRTNLELLIDAVGRVLPADTVLVPETASVTGAIMTRIKQDRAGTFIGRLTGGLGVGLGTALGVALAESRGSGRLVVSVMGDGTLNYNPTLAALGFAQEYGIPLIVVVVTNGAYVSMKDDLLAAYPGGAADRSGVHYGSPIDPPPRYADLAAIFGGVGETVVDLAAIDAALTRAVDTARNGKLAVLDVRLGASDTEGVL